MARLRLGAERQLRRGSRRAFAIASCRPRFSCGIDDVERRRRPPRPCRCRARPDAPPRRCRAPGPRRRRCRPRRARRPARGPAAGRWPRRCARRPPRRSAVPAMSGRAEHGQDRRRVLDHGEQSPDRAARPSTDEPAAEPLDRGEFRLGLAPRRAAVTAARQTAGSASSAAAAEPKRRSSAKNVTGPTPSVG